MAKYTEEIKMDSFVYKWTNLTLGKIYIGYHKGLEDDGYICSSASKLFWDDFNNQTYVWHRDIVYKGSMRDCQLYESHLLDNLDITSKLVYNNKNNLMFNFNEEVKRKLSDAAVRRGRDPEYRRQQSERSKLLWQDPKHRERISKANTGKKASYETRLKIKEARKHQVITPESRSKAVQKLIGVPRPQHVKEAIAAARKNAPTVVCPHCGTVGKFGGSMKRWHFTNCEKLGDILET